MTTITKKIKVQLNDSASHWGYDNHTYYPGDIFEVPESMFVPYLMTEVTEPKKKSKSIVKAAKAAEPTVEESIKAGGPLDKAAPKIRRGPGPRKAKR